MALESATWKGGEKLDEAHKRANFFMCVPWVVCLCIAPMFCPPEPPKQINPDSQTLSESAAIVNQMFLKEMEAVINERTTVKN